jgi:hypothetical protein
MAKLDPLNRLQQLAGVRGSTRSVAEDFGDDEIEVADDFGDDFGGFADDNIGVEGDDFGTDNDFGNDTQFADDDMGGDLAGDSFGGELEGPAPLVAPNQIAPVESQAYTCILGYLNDVQTSLGDVKLSEYKSLVKKLEDLTMQVRGMGRDYLGERRKK